MRILLLSTHLNAGGITSYLSTLAGGLIRHGHPVCLVSSGGDREKDFIATGAKLLNLNIKTKSELSPKIYFPLKSLSSFIVETQIDVIHAHTRITQVMASALKYMTERPIVTTCHGFFQPKLSRKIFPCWGDAVIAISQPVADHLKEDLCAQPDRIFLIENGIDLDQFSPCDSKIKEDNRRLYQLGNGPLIGIVARLSEVKGQDILIQAMKSVSLRIPQAKLLIVGMGKEETDLKNLVRHLGLQERVLFFPVTNKTAEFLSMLDVFVMPSRQEGLGLSVMEAQAAGLPVVASEIGGIPSLIEHEKTGFLVPPEDPEALAACLIKVLQNLNAAQRVGMAAREFIAQNHSAERMVEKTLALYQKLIQAM